MPEPQSWIRLSRRYVPVAGRGDGSTILARLARGESLDDPPLRRAQHVLIADLRLTHYRLFEVDAPTIRIMHLLQTTTTIEQLRRAVPAAEVEACLPVLALMGAIVAGDPERLRNAERAASDAPSAASGSRHRIDDLRPLESFAPQGLQC